MTKTNKNLDRFLNATEFKQTPKKITEIKTTYQSKNWNKRLSKWCEENKIKKEINKQIAITKDDFVNNIDHNFFKIEDLDQQSFILRTILRNQSNDVLETLNIYIKSKI